MPTSIHTLDRQCAPRTVIHLDAHRPVVLRVDDGSDTPASAGYRKTVEHIAEGRREMERRERGLAACTSDRCNSGRKPCPTPEACRVPDPEDVHRWDLLWIVLGYLCTSWRLPVVLILACSFGWGIHAAAELLPRR